ncbi:Uncharacterised protein [Mesomycoplasma dispar]|uniref:DUF1410 domain-containing protein n=1 Tax=Mesomycoplasma dispar TaxID=86660 RepID=A0AAJ5NSB0_9BACT|nr:DUF1410 domain-containing protein [Mesomycoplasma dispar]AJR12161.1 hypothetical protein MDIS_01695 [Mesomycoplasma dispar]VEU61686.1 Uncharacterised protein [Mesomycoplasma dispar]
MKNEANSNQNSKTLNSHLTKKLLAAGGFVTGAIVSLSPYLAKIISPKTIYVTDFVANNVTANSGEFSFKLQGKNQADTAWVKKADLELVYISKNSRYQVKTKVEYDPKTNSFFTFADNLVGGSVYEVQLVAANNPRYYFSFTNSSQFFSTKNQVEKFSHYDIENDTILNLNLFDSQNLLQSANLILYYKEVGTDKILTANGQFSSQTEEKQASFVLRNLKKTAKYEVVAIKYHFDDPDQTFDLEISPLASRFFAASPLGGKIVNLSQKSYGLNSALVEISLALNNQKVKLEKNEKINLEYYWKDESGAHQFGVANDVSLVFDANNKIYANLDLKQIPGGAKFWISRIWNNSGTLAIKVENKLSFISAPEIARIKTFVDGNNTSSFDVKFNDQSLLLNGKDVKINFFADDRPTKMLSAIGQVVGNKLFSFAKNLEKEKHFTISSLEIVNKATNFDESGQQQTSTIFFSQNFDQKEKKFFTHATSAQVESITTDKISEDSTRISVVLDSIDDFIKDKIATLYFRVAGSNSLIKSEAQAFKINGNKLVLTWDLINLEPGTNYLIDSIGIADANQQFVNKLYLNFGANIGAEKLNWTTKPAVSSISYIPRSENSVALNIAIKNILEPLKTAKIKYTELKPGGQTRTIQAQINNNSIISNLLVDNLEKGLDYRIDSIEIDGYKSSKGDADILKVSKTITPAQRIFGVHAPLVLTEIKNTSEQQTSAKLEVKFSPETIKAIGNNRVKVYYSLAGSSKLLSAEASLGTQQQQQNKESVTFELKDLEIGSKYNINSVVLVREIQPLLPNQQTITTERNILFGDASHQFQPSQSSFFTKSAVIEVGYDNSYEQRVIATFTLADAKGDFLGKTAKLKYTLKKKNGDEKQAESAQKKEGEITAPVVGARIRFDITDLYKQGLYEIDKNSLEIVDGTTAVAAPAGAAVQTSSRVRREVSQFQAQQNQAKIIPFKENLLDSTEKSQFSTIPKTANVTSLTLKKRTKNTAEFEIEFGKEFSKTAEVVQSAEKLDDFLNTQKLKVRFKKYGGEEQVQEVQATKNVETQKTTFNLTGLENGQQYVILGFEQVKEENSEKPEVKINLDDLDFYKDQVIATSAVIKKLEVDTSVETQAKVHLELKDGGRYTAGKKVTVELEKVDGTGGGAQQVGQSSTFKQEATSLNGIYDFTFLNLEKVAKYKIKSVKFEKDPEIQPQASQAQTQAANLVLSRSKRSLVDPNIQQFKAVFVNVQTALTNEEEIDLLENQESELEPKKTFVTSAQSAKVTKIEHESQQTTSLTVKLTLDKIDDYLGSKQITLTYKNLSQNKTQSTQDATVNEGDKTISFPLTGLNPGDRYEIESLQLKDETTGVRNEKQLKKSEFKFEFDKSPTTQAGFEKQFFSPIPNLAEIKPESTSETSVRITVKLNDKAANWNGKFLQIKLESKNAVPPQSQNSIYTAQIANGLAVFEISGLQKAGNYEIKEMKYSDNPAENSASSIQGQDVEGFSKTHNPQQPQEKIKKEFELDAESATITDISYKSDNYSADVTVKFDSTETFLTKESNGKKRKLKFYFKNSQTGEEVTTEKEFENQEQQQKRIQQPELTLNLGGQAAATGVGAVQNSPLKAGSLYLLTKVEDITEEGGPKKLKTFKFDKDLASLTPAPQPQAQTQTPEVLSKLFFATKPEIIAYSIEKKDETTYVANFDIADPLAGRDIEKGGFEGRNVTVKLERVFEPNGEEAKEDKPKEIQVESTVQKSKINFEIKDNFTGFEKNATYKVKSVEWADKTSNRGTGSQKKDPTVKLSKPDKNTNGLGTQNFENFAIKKLDGSTDSNIEGNVAGNGRKKFGDNFIIKPESAKIINIEKNDKKDNSAIITVSFDPKDKYLEHSDYKEKLKLVYYQVGDPEEKKAELKFESAQDDAVKFKADLTDLSGGNGYRIVRIENDAAQARSRRRRSTDAITNAQNQINFYFDDQQVQEDNKKFATLPIINSILQFRNDKNPEDYDFLLTLKDTGDVFKDKTNIKAKIQYKKVVDGNQAKATIEEVVAELQKVGQGGISSQNEKKSDEENLEKSTTFKFTLTGLDIFAQYYIENIAYDSNSSTDSILNKAKNPAQVTNSESSGLFKFSDDAEKKRAFVTFPDKVEIKKVDIKPDFAQNTAKVELTFDAKYKPFLEVYRNFTIAYKNPKGITQEVQVDKDNFVSNPDLSSGEPKVEVTINNISEPGQYIIDSLKFADEKSQQIKAISNLELPPVAIKETISINDRSFYTNTKIIAIRKKQIGERHALIEFVLDDPNGSFIGKKVSGTFIPKLDPPQTQDQSKTRTESVTIVADEIGKTSKAVFNLRSLIKNTEYTISKLEFEQGQGQTGGDKSQFATKQDLSFDDAKILEEENKDKPENKRVKTVEKIKKFKTKFRKAKALGITYQLDQKKLNPTPWKKAKVRVFFGKIDTPLMEGKTKTELKLVYQSSKAGISKISEKFVAAEKKLVKDLKKELKKDKTWKNIIPKKAHFYYEFELDNLDSGAEYTVIGLQDKKNKIKIGLPAPVGTTVNVASLSSRSLAPSFTFNTAPLITKLAYVSHEHKVRLIFDVENSQKLDFSNWSMEIKYKKLDNQKNKYGWTDPSNGRIQKPFTVSKIKLKKVVDRGPVSQDSDASITRIEADLKGLEKGSWYLIDEVSIADPKNKKQALSLYIDKDKMQPNDKKISTRESEKWQTIVNTSIETATISKVKTSTDKNGIQVEEGGKKVAKKSPELRKGWFEVEFDKKDLAFLKDKYNIQLELESVEKKLFYTKTVPISSSSGSGVTTKVVVEADGLIPGDKYIIKNYIFTLKPGEQDKYGVNLPANLIAKPPKNKDSINLLTKNAIKSIKHEPKAEGQTDITVELYNNNGNLDGKKLKLSAQMDTRSGNGKVSEEWRKDGQKGLKVSGEGNVETNSSGKATQKNNIVKFSINSNLKKDKIYNIKEITVDDGNKGKKSEKLTFDTPIDNEYALQRRFYSKAETAKLTKTTISEVTYDSAKIVLEFDKEDVFLDGDTITLYLEKTDKSQSIGSTTTITSNSGKNSNKLEATFNFLNTLEAGTKYKIKTITSKTVNLSVEQNTKAVTPDLARGWKSSSSSSSSTTTTSSVDLEFITKPLITDIKTTEIQDTSAKIEIVGWTKDLTDAGFTASLTVKEKQSSSGQQQQQQPKTGQQDNTSQTNNSRKFNFTSLTKFTEYNQITLKIRGGSGNVASVNSEQEVDFAPEISSGAKQNLREFRTTAKDLLLATSNPVKIIPITTTSTNIEIELQEQDAKSIAEIPFILKYKKAWPNVYAKDALEQTSQPVLINTETKKLTFNLGNLEAGIVYSIEGLEPLDPAIRKDHQVREETLKVEKNLLKLLDEVANTPWNPYPQNGNKKKIYFTSMNKPVKLERGWSVPLRYDYYEGEQVYIRFNKESATAINEEWLKNNLTLRLIPHKTFSASYVSQNPEKLIKRLSQSKAYSEKNKGVLNDDLEIANLEWNPETAIAKFKLLPWSLKAIVGSELEISINDKNNYPKDPTYANSNPYPNPSIILRKQSIRFKVSTQTMVVTPTNVDYMNPGLIGFSFAIYDPADLIEPTGKDYNPFGEFTSLTPYKEQNWLKVIANNGWKQNVGSQIERPERNIFKNPSSGFNGNPFIIDIPEEPVAIRTKTKFKKDNNGVKYLTLYWRIPTNLGKFQFPEKFKNAKNLWYPAGKLVSLPISLQFKTKSKDSNFAIYSFVAKSPFATPGFIMPYSSNVEPHDAISIINQGVDYQAKWKKSHTDDLIPRITKRERNISKVFWSAPSYSEWTTNEGDLNTIFYQNRKNPILANGTNQLAINTGDPHWSRGTRYTGHNWKILYVKNREGHQSKPTIEKVDANWNYQQQATYSFGFENQRARSSWIISMTTNPQGYPLLYDPINYYDMLGPFEVPELPDKQIK